MISHVIRKMSSSFFLASYQSMLVLSKAVKSGSHFSSHGPKAYFHPRAVAAAGAAIRKARTENIILRKNIFANYLPMQKKMKLQSPTRRSPEPNFEQRRFPRKAMQSWIKARAPKSVTTRDRATKALKILLNLSTCPTSTTSTTKIVK